jgi:threonylcarbamoyladenosine tRNA methylthiotransferase MtaB
MFENTLSIVGEADLTYLHVFPFSPRPGTPAAKMPQVPRNVARARAKRLREVGAERFATHLRSRIGQLEEVLVERDGLGRTAQFTPIALSGRAAGEVVAARVVGTSPTGLVGEALRTAA